MENQKVEKKINNQEQSVNPGINEPFLNNNDTAESFLDKWEVESRDIFVHHKKIIEIMNIKEGMTVVDLGAGTGLFMEGLAKSVGANGKVYLLDISDKLINYLEKRRQSLGLNPDNVIIKKMNPFQVPLLENSIDIFYLGDVYHHLEYPNTLLKSIYQSLKSTGSLFIIDFEKIPGKSREWVMGHVRADKETVFEELKNSNFKVVEEIPLLQENYFIKCIPE
jgi:ubiquinone/menaquinone biosynthesis C-methylase UbiE